MVDPQTEDISYSSENFNPMKFLLEIHNSTALNELENGLKCVIDLWIDL